MVGHSIEGKEGITSFFFFAAFVLFKACEKKADTLCSVVVFSPPFPTPYKETTAPS